MHAGLHEKEHMILGALEIYFWLQDYFMIYLIQGQNLYNRKVSSLSDNQ